jgi:AraC family transcriptional regulator, arabinose operon regulatory protein
MDPRIQAALGIIASEYRQALTIAHVAGRIGLSPSRLEHLLKTEVGQPFRSYLRETRLNEAEKLLADYRLSIKEVAGAVGYSYVPNFTRDFRNRFGMSPSNFRKKRAAQQNSLRNSRKC